MYVAVAAVVAAALMAGDGAPSAAPPSEGAHCGAGEAAAPGAAPSDPSARPAVESAPHQGGARGVDLLGTAPDAHKPLSLRVGGTALDVSALLVGRVDGWGGFPVDSQGARFGDAPSVNLLARLGLRFTTARAALPWVFGATAEGDLITGPVAGPQAPAGDGYPGVKDPGHTLRQASAFASYLGAVTVAGGYMMSHWGMGLVANDGAHGWRPGSATFTDPRGGDRVLRGALKLGPWRQAHGLSLALAYDEVQGDDALLAGDTAKQLVMALQVGGEGDEEDRVGAYVVRRSQRARSKARTDVWVLDGAGQVSGRLSGGVTLKVEAEVAVITGETELGAAVAAPVHDVLQVGAAARLSVDAGGYGGVIGLLYASGDRDADDATQGAFHADVNYDMGLLLFPAVIAAQTAREPVTAADPTLVGTPAADLERLPTRGAVSGALALHPRLWVRPLDGLEITFGPLLAFSTAPYADPRQTRVAGGVPHSPLGGEAGSFLGTELDLGVRYTAALWGSELGLAMEGALLVPGDAMRAEDGALPLPLVGGRALVQLRL